MTEKVSDNEKVEKIVGSVRANNIKGVGKNMKKATKKKAVKKVVKAVVKKKMKKGGY